MKFVLYTMIGSVLMLVPIITMYFLHGNATGTYTFSYPDILTAITSGRLIFVPRIELYLFLAFFIAFAIKVPLFPFHTWLPDAHVEAPTAGSVLLAGVLLKMGTYGMIRFSLPLFPNVSHLFAPIVMFLAVVGIVYGALVALVQRDFKFVIGYSSVSHMGFVLLGLMTLTTIGLSGAVLQMFSHGIIAGLLFGVVGRIVYDRTHTRDFGDLESMHLNRAIPFAAGTFVIAGLASMGMPGFSGFIAELQVLIGAWQAFPTLAVISGSGIIIGVAYTLRAIQKSFYSGARTDANPGAALLEAISVPERIGAVVLLGATIVIGLYPTLLLNLIKSGFNSPLMSPLVKGGGL